jgi:hypothetical protein
VLQVNAEPIDLIESVPNRIEPALNFVKNPSRGSGTSAWALIAEGMIVREQTTFGKSWIRLTDNLLDLSCSKRLASVTVHCRFDHLMIVHSISSSGPQELTFNALLRLVIAPSAVV